MHRFNRFGPILALVDGKHTFRGKTFQYVIRSPIRSSTQLGNKYRDELRPKRVSRSNGSACAGSVCVVVIGGGAGTLPRSGRVWSGPPSAHQRRRRAAALPADAAAAETAARARVRGARRQAGPVAPCL